MATNLLPLPSFAQQPCKLSANEVFVLKPGPSLPTRPSVGRADLLEALDRRLRGLARAYMQRERHDHTLQPTALVNEAYLRLAGDRNVDWNDRSGFFGRAARAMRQVLIDHARRRNRAKRNSGANRVPLDSHLSLGVDPQTEMNLAVDRSLEALRALDPRMARIVDLIGIAGLTQAEVAEQLEISPQTVHREWRLARSWLRKELTKNAVV